MARASQIWHRVYVGQVADPEDACTRLKAPAVGRAPWIALIIRSQRVHTNCTFDFKVQPAWDTMSRAVSCACMLHLRVLQTEIGALSCYGSTEVGSSGARCCH